MIHGSNDENGIKYLPILEENALLALRTNTDTNKRNKTTPSSILQKNDPVSSTLWIKEPVTLDSLPTSLYPRKYKRVTEI